MIALLIIAALVSSASAAIKTEKVDYQADGKAMVGYLAYDDSSSAARPAVLVFPEWWGNDAYAHRRAEELAKLGYVGFAVDMYGQGKTTDDPKQAAEWSTEIKKDPALANKRITAALQCLKSNPHVDQSKLAAIGYCFGGSMALQMARLNMPVKGVVSFHGDLATSTPATKVTPRVLVCTGSDDAFVPASQVEQFEKEMKDAGAVWKVVTYDGAHHSFTNPDADRHKIPNIQYDEKADKQSWEEMKSFLADLFK
jgi:dienelactone hydrolase